MRSLRQYQDILKASIYEAWRCGFKNVLATMPTGAGKTVTFCSIIIDMAVLATTNKTPAVVGVHRKELVQQISLTLAEAGIVHNIIAPRNVIEGIVSAQRQLFKRQFYDYNSIVSVMSVDTINARIEKHQKWAASIRLWIIDEATHVLKTNKWGKACGYFPNAIGLGVTATPERLDKRGLGRHADGVFDTMVEGPSTRWLIENGYLCNYKIAVPACDYRDHLKESSGDADYSKEAMLNAARNSHIVGDTVENYLKFAKGKQAIIFADSIQTAERIEKQFNDKGISAKLLTAETPDRDRWMSMQDYKARKIHVLINVDLFDEGLDVPGIDCVIMARPTKSLSKYLQMVGRGLRPVYSKGVELETKEGRLAAIAASAKPHLILIDHVRNVMDHGLPDDRRSWTLDRIVRRRMKTSMIRICQNLKCSWPYDRLLSTCPYCMTDWEPSGGGGGGKLSLTQADGDLMLLDPDTLRELEGRCKLDAPAEVAKRVGAVAGPAAARKAMSDQMERVKMQTELGEAIARWAGWHRWRGDSDRALHKRFFLEYEMSISDALSMTRAEMEDFKTHTLRIPEGAVG